MQKIAPKNGWGSARVRAKCRGGRPRAAANLAAKRHSLYDGKYTDMAYGFWNAMGNWGSVVVDLGAVRTVKGVRLTLRSSGSNQPVGFQVFGGTTSMYTGFTHAVDFVEPYQEDLAPIYIPVSNRSARYLYIAGSNNASWLAYSEIEVYGN